MTSHYSDGKPFGDTPPMLEEENLMDDDGNDYDDEQHERSNDLGSNYEKDDDDDDDDDDNDVDDNNDWTNQIVQSTWQDDVEVGLVVTWPIGTANVDGLVAGGGESDPAGNDSDNKNHDNDEDVATKQTTILHLSTQLSASNLAPLFDGTAWAGTRVWKAALLATKWMEEHINIEIEDDNVSKDNVSASSLLELGCGLGVPGLIWHRLGELRKESGNPTKRIQHCHSRRCRRRVVLTDRPDLIPQLQANIAANFPPPTTTCDDQNQSTDGNSDNPCDSMIEARSLDWSQHAVEQLLQNEGRPFDMVLNCDCIYEPLYGREAWQRLADVLSTIALQTPDTLLITSVERRNQDGLESFMERFASNMMMTGSTSTSTTTNTTTTSMTRVVHDDTDPHHVIEIYVTRGRDWKL